MVDREIEEVSADFEGRWFHIIATTYGAWLRGDARGFRARHHREHIEGDYKAPPPRGTHARQHVRSMRLLKEPAVTFPEEWRPIIGLALKERFSKNGAFVLCMAVAPTHVHILAKIPRPKGPRSIMGLAKKHATFEAHRLGWSGRLWAKRGKEIEIEGRAHQLGAYRYILAHRDQGAWVWNWMDKRSQ